MDKKRRLQPLLAVIRSTFHPLLHLHELNDLEWVSAINGVERVLRWYQQGDLPEEMYPKLERFISRYLRMLPEIALTGFPALRLPTPKDPERVEINTSGRDKKYAEAARKGYKPHK